LIRVISWMVPLRRGYKVALLSSSTDSPTFRQIGIIAYGFEPFELDDGDLERSHGNDETGLSGEHRFRFSIPPMW
jgi:hypothetical protein